MGENPVTETIRLKLDDNYNHKTDYSFELRTDGTARYIDNDNYDKEHTSAELTYTYNADKKEIYMRMEKNDWFSDTDTLLTYDETRSKINEYYSVEKIRQSYKDDYDEDKDKSWFKEEYPDCDTYEKYEAAIVKKYGYKSFDDMIKTEKQSIENTVKNAFGAKETYSYEIKGGKMTLTGKFTGVKNIVYSGHCSNRYESVYCDIDCIEASIRIYGNPEIGYSGTPNTDNKTIRFQKRIEDEKKSCPCHRHLHRRHRKRNGNNKLRRQRLYLQV